MGPVLNKVSVIVRITGLAADLAALTPSLAQIEGKTVLRPETVPDSALPEAWWAIEVVQHNQESTELAIIEALDLLNPLQDTIKDVASDSRLQIEMDCTVDIDTERPVIEVSAHSLKRLACLNAALGFEIYDYRE